MWLTYNILSLAIIEILSFSDTDVMQIVAGICERLGSCNSNGTILMEPVCSLLPPDSPRFHITPQNK